LSQDPEHPALEGLRGRLREEEAAYAEVLAAVDRLSGFPVPAEAAPEVRERLLRLNELWPAPERPAGGGPGGALRRRAWDAVSPAIERQAAFNAVLVQLLNGYLAQADGLHARLRDLASALVRYAQRVQPLVDARARLATTLATTRSELVLEAFDRRLESLGRRLEGLVALRDRLEAVSEEVRAEDSAYTALGNRLRGSREEIRERFRASAERFEGGPVVHLGCRGGELLQALGERGIAARGVAGHANVVHECREMGLDVVEGDVVDFLRAQAAGSLGGVFAAQVAKHLSPVRLVALLAEAHRALRPGGLLLLETVNPRSVTGYLEVYGRDLVHERPLHPDALLFLAGAAGFTDARVEMGTPVSAESQLRPVPAEGLPQPAADALNENVARLNALLYGHLEYALVARR